MVRNRMNNRSRRKAIVLTRPVYNHMGNYMPNMFRTKFSYYYNAGATMNANNNIIQVFRGNSIYDPDYSGAGTRALGAYEMASIYNHYRVVGSRITVTASPKTVAEVGMLVVYPSTDVLVTGATSMKTLQAHPNAVRALCGQDEAPKTVVSYCSSNVPFGVGTADDPDFTSAISANPTNVWYWNVGIAGIENDTFNLDVTVEYYTILYELTTTYQAAL